MYIKGQRFRLTTKPSHLYPGVRKGSVVTLLYSVINNHGTRGFFTVKRNKGTDTMYLYFDHLIPLEVKKPKPVPQIAFKKGRKILDKTSKR